MNIISIDLYQYFGITPPPNAGATLECWLGHTPELLRENRHRPAVLILPGGGYACTSHREAEPVALPFAAKGYGVFILYYSCAPNVFPVALREAAMAMNLIRERAKEWEIDPDMVAAMGFSAGGHLCGTLGTMYDCPEVLELGLSTHVRPDALALCYPVAIEWGRTHEGSFQKISGGDQKLRARLSLDRQVRPDMPPVFLWHTRDDNAVPVRNSLVLAAALNDVGVEFALHIYRSGPHGLSTADAMVYPASGIPDHSSDVDRWPQEVISFFKEVGLHIRDIPRGELALSDIPGKQ